MTGFLLPKLNYIRLGPSVKSVSDGARDVTNTEFALEGARNLQMVVTLEPVQ